MPKLHTSTSSDSKRSSPYAVSSKPQRKRVSFSEPEKKSKPGPPRKRPMTSLFQSIAAPTAAASPDSEVRGPMTRARTKAKESKAPANVKDDSDSSDDDEPVFRTPTEDSPEDIRALFAHLNYPEDKMEELVVYMRRPHNLGDIPSYEEIFHSIKEEYCFGFYTSDSDILAFCKKYKKDYVPSGSTDARMTEMTFITDYLSLLMNQRDVTLRRVVVTQKHKDNIPNIVERVGHSAFVLSVISTDHIEEPRYQPTNREVVELSYYLKQKPFWWETCD
ncbi:hypothetical protein EIP91_001940 [Steccherinum ochraceum]|uniref:Uncharacterized protein n=1 Tax=Steccherinum ochraceum TaxID=92696 RepID=A0A4R0RGU1_9APHY|nr:hypothetical protein EIP91_001940 [Steccherinum ochraceum]